MKSVLKPQPFVIKKYKSQIYQGDRISKVADYEDGTVPSPTSPVSLPSIDKKLNTSRIKSIFQGQESELIWKGDIGRPVVYTPGSEKYMIKAGGKGLYRQDPNVGMLPDAQAYDPAAPRKFMIKETDGQSHHKYDSSVKILKFEKGYTTGLDKYVTKEDGQWFDRQGQSVKIIQDALGPEATTKKEDGQRFEKLDPSTRMPEDTKALGWKTGRKKYNFNLFSQQVEHPRKKLAMPIKLSLPSGNSPNYTWMETNYYQRLAKGMNVSGMDIIEAFSSYPNAISQSCINKWLISKYRCSKYGSESCNWKDIYPVLSKTRNFMINKSL